MKKMALFFAIMFMLPVPLIFAADNTAPLPGEAPYNGVTFFDTGKEPDCTAAASSAPGGSSTAENGVTVFDARPGGADGKCAGEPTAAEAIKTMNNGVTVFNSSAK